MGDHVNADRFFTRSYQHDRERSAATGNPYRNAIYCLDKADSVATVAAIVGMVVC